MRIFFEVSIHGLRFACLHSVFNKTSNNFSHTTSNTENILASFQLIYFTDKSLYKADAILNVRRDCKTCINISYLNIELFYIRTNKIIFTIQYLEMKVRANVVVFINKGHNYDVSCDISLYIII